MLKSFVIKNKNPASSYSIFIENNLLKNLHWLPKHVHNIVIITDNKVKKLYGTDLQKSLIKLKKRVLLLSFRPGESSKNYHMKYRLEKKMLQQHFDRDTFILALGGGVVGDLAGFIAATYMRGISYIHISTTFLSMIDSSIGGKTGINTAFGKNSIGAFWNPYSVVIDTQCLKTLPRKHFMNGLIEALKIFIVQDKKNFHFVYKNIQDVLNHGISNYPIILESIRLKSKIIMKDAKEKNIRAILNFGHTIGHALETLSGYKILHGFAVGYGMLVEAKISELLGKLSHAEYLKIAEILLKFGLHPKKLKIFDIKKILAIIKSDKKSKDGKARYVLIKNIGAVYDINNQYTHNVPIEIVQQAFFAVSQTHAR